jgi:hypothetical protein
VLTVPVVAAKVVLDWFRAMLTLTGTVKDALLLLSATVTELVAGLFSDTVQVLDALLPNELGEQETEESCAGAFPVSVKV